ncbi:MAG: hypothetical protein KC516_03650 [Nanoarchaeota archaeon]|nr:hypothetical protein [Nanoarchaeota archaeon]
MKKAVNKTKTNFETIAYVLGIVAIVEAVFSPLLGVVFSIIGLVLASKQKSPMSKKAKVLNLIGLIIGVVFFAVILVLSLTNSAIPTNLY